MEHGGLCLTTYIIQIDNGWYCLVGNIWIWHNIVSFRGKLLMGPKNGCGIDWYKMGSIVRLIYCTTKKLLNSII